MSVETWIGFCTASVVLALLPSPLASLIARYALQKGRRSALIAVAGAALGLGAALTVAAAPLIALVWAAPSFLEPLSWLGLAYLMLYVLWSFQDPTGRSPRASNDNLPEQKPVGIFVHLLTVCLRNGRYVAALAALMTLFVTPALALGTVMFEMQAVFLLLVTSGFAVHVAFPRRTIDRRRRPSSFTPASHKMGTRFIARRAVTAGYRRIAA